MKGNPMRVSLALACWIVSTIAAADITSPEVLERNPVPYPIEAKKLASEGDVDLRVWVNANGTAGEVTVLRSSGDAHLDRAAAVGVKDWKYKPSRRDSGEVIGDTLLVKVHFQLTDEDMQLAPPQSQLQRYARIWANYVAYRAKNEAIYRQCEAAGVSASRARIEMAKLDAGLDEKLDAVETRIKRLHSSAGMNSDPDQHIQHMEAEARAQADRRFMQESNEWSTAERSKRCHETLENMELGFGSYGDSPEYEILMSF
jgi:TonB family protein